MGLHKNYKTNEYIDKGEYYEITVNSSETKFKIDKDDYNFAKLHNWWSFKRVVNDNVFEYLVTKVRTEKNERIHKKYHIMLMENKIKQYKSENDYDKQIIVDHINGDTTDDRKDNLRVRTQSENNMNKVIQCNNTSGIVGVFWHSRDKIWNPRVSINGKQINLGSYYYLRNAVKSRMKAERQYFGEHAFINRDENYQKFIKEILDLPDKIEPIIWNIKYGEKAKLWSLSIASPSRDIHIVKKFKTEELAKEYLHNYQQENPNEEYIEKSKKTIKTI